MEQKDWTEDFKYENGNYSNICKNCKHEFSGHKRRFLCKECAGVHTPYIKELISEEAQNTSVRFGAWLLKYATPFNSREYTCWRYEGREYSTYELFLEFKTLENLTSAESII